VLVVWTAAWLAAGVYVYASVRNLEAYGEAAVSAATGLDQAHHGLRRASAGLVETGAALDDVPFVGGLVGADIRRAARDIDTVASTVRTTALQTRASGRQTIDSASGIAVILGAAVALTPTLPVIWFYLLFRPLVLRQLRER
jgi:hypothetical protein